MSYTKFEDINLQAYRGDTESYTFSIMNGSVGYDMSGWSVYAQARAYEDDHTVLFDTRSVSGMAIANGTNGSVYAVGKVVMVVTDAITKILPTHCKYDLQGYTGSTLTTLARGDIKTTKDVSRE